MQAAKCPNLKLWKPILQTIWNQIRLPQSSISNMPDSRSRVVSLIPAQSHVFVEIDQLTSITYLFLFLSPQKHLVMGVH